MLPQTQVSNSHHTECRCWWVGINTSRNVLFWFHAVSDILLFTFSFANHSEFPCAVFCVHQGLGGGTRGVTSELYIYTATCAEWNKSRWLYKYTGPHKTDRPSLSFWTAMVSFVCYCSVFCRSRMIEFTAFVKELLAFSQGTSNPRWTNLHCKRVYYTFTRPRCINIRSRSRDRMLHSRSETVFLRVSCLVTSW
jgi:hypothetical protein